jgi:peptide/nickel transport system permease protein
LVSHVLVRSVHSLILVGFAILAVFLVVRLLPGDPVTAITGEYPVPAAYAAEIRQSYGIDKPLPVQFGLYVAALARGDLGFSFKNQKSVGQLLRERGANTLLLGGTAFVVATMVGVTLGVVSATRRLGFADRAIRAFAAISYAAPVFWIGQLLILLLAVQLRILPVAGMSSTRGVSPGLGQFVDLLQHLLLPAVVLALPIAAIHTRILRVSLAPTPSPTADALSTATLPTTARRLSGATAAVHCISPRIAGLPLAQRRVRALGDLGMACRHSGRLSSRPRLWT